MCVRVCGVCARVHVYECDCVCVCVNVYIGVWVREPLCLVTPRKENEGKCVDILVHFKMKHDHAYFIHCVIAGLVSSETI